MYFCVLLCCGRVFSFCVCVFFFDSYRLFFVCVLFVFFSLSFCWVFRFFKNVSDELQLDFVFLFLSVFSFGLIVSGLFFSFFLLFFFVGSAI